MGTEYNTPPNSQAAKAKAAAPTEKKEVKKIVTGPVVERKKPLGRKMKDLIAAADAKGAWQHVWSYVIIPSAKGMALEAINRGGERMLLGDQAARRTGSQQSGVKIAYHNPPGHRHPQDPRQAQRQASPGSSSDREFLLRSKEEADRVLDEMSHLASTYGQVSVAELKGMLGREVIEHTDHKFGWDTLVGTRAVQMRDGWLLDLPPRVVIQSQ